MTRVGRLGLVFGLLLSLSAAAFSQQIYISNESKRSLELLDLSTLAISTLYNIGAEPDDLTLNSKGQLIYSVPSLGTVNLFDPKTGQNTVLATGLKFVRDLAIEPSGKSMLIAVYTPGKIVRLTFATGVTTVLVSGLGTCDGIAYDYYRHLYAVANHNTIIQINPTTGAILNTLLLEAHQGVNGGDGLTYDKFTRSLWASHDGTTGFGLLQIPINSKGFASTTFSFFPTPWVRALDGIKSDGKGNLYIGAIHTLAVYNIPTNTVTKNITVNGADGVSLVPGTY